MYTCSQHLWRTIDDGHTWQMISPDLTRGDPKTLGDSGGPITHDQNGPEIYGTIFTIAPSHKEKDTIWTGSDDGLVYITRDGGKHWTKITPPGHARFRARQPDRRLAATMPATAYVAVKNYQNDDRKPYIFKTSDYGKTWTKIVNGIPENDFVHAVREDPGSAACCSPARNTASTFPSTTARSGNRSRSICPIRRCPDLVIEGNDLVIATHGRSFYILDNITPLRQLTPAC